MEVDTKIDLIEIALLFLFAVMVGFAGTFGVFALLEVIRMITT
jgi:hypothetical protein